MYIVVKEAISKGLYGDVKIVKGLFIFDGFEVNIGLRALASA